MAFLGCIDETKETSDAVAAAAGCASSTTPTLDMSAVKTCYNGQEGDDLLVAASAIWNKAFPSRATVPHVFVNGENVQANYAAIKTVIGLFRVHDSILHLCNHFLCCMTGHLRCRSFRERLLSPNPHP